MDPGHLLQAHGYWIVALGSLLEGETTLALGGVAAHAGYLDLRWVIAIAAACGFAGDELLFTLGRRYGSGLLKRVPKIASQAERMQRLVERHQSWLVISVRFLYGLRLVGPIVIGASGLSPWRFALFNALGAVLWAILIGGLGWAFGQAAGLVFGQMQRIEAAVASVLLVAIVYVLRRTVRR